MMAPKLRFSRGLKAKAPGAVTACVPGPLRSHSSKFLQARGPRLAQEATMGKVTIFFFFYLRGSYKCMIVILPTFWHSAPAWDFSWQLTSNVSLATVLVFVPTIPRRVRRLWQGERSLWVETARSSFTAEVWSFSPQAPPSLVSSPSKYPPSFVALAFNKTKPALSSFAVVTKAIKRTARTACRIWEHPQRCFPPFGQKPREAKKNCFLNEKGPEEQAANNELTKKTPRRHATTTTSVAGLWQMRRHEIEVGRIYTSLATGMVVLATYIYVPWQWTG